MVQREHGEITDCTYPYYKQNKIPVRKHCNKKIIKKRLLNLGFKYEYM